MSRNYGIGSRDMSRAGCMLLDRMSHEGKCSFATAPAYKSGWRSFSEEAKDFGIKRMEHITRAFVVSYGKSLADDVRNGVLKASTAQGYLTAVNRVMTAVRPNWKSVSSIKECKIPQRHFVRDIAPIDRQRFETFITTTTHQRHKALYLLCREFGLRSKEAACLDIQKALREARKNQWIEVNKGTKGGRDRYVQITNEERQIRAHEFAKSQLGKNDTALIPKELNLAQYKHGEMRNARVELEEQTNATGLHELRAAYACERYRELTGHDAPCISQSGHREITREEDHAARLVIAKELGHGRIDVVAAYVGSSK